MQGYDETHQYENWNNVSFSLLDYMHITSPYEIKIGGFVDF